MVLMRSILFNLDGLWHHLTGFLLIADCKWAIILFDKNKNAQVPMVATWAFNYVFLCLCQIIYAFKATLGSTNS